MARTSAKAQLSRMQIVEEEKRMTHPALQMNSSNSSLSGSGGGSVGGSISGSVAGSGNGRSAASTLIRTLPESQGSTNRGTLNLVLSASNPNSDGGISFQSPGDDQLTTSLSGLSHPTQFHLNQLEKKHQHIRSLLTDGPVQNQQLNSNLVSIRGDATQEPSRATASTNSPNGMGSSDQIEDLELAGLASEFIDDTTDINRIVPTMSYDGPTGSVIEQNQLFNSSHHRTATSVVEGFHQMGNSASIGLGGGIGGGGSHSRRSAPSSLPARFNFGNNSVVVPVRQVTGGSTGMSGNSGGCMPAVVGSAESGSGTTVGGGQSSSRAASRSSLMVAEDDASNSAEMKQRQKKDQHNKVERKRREQINHFIAMLGDMLPKRMFEGNDNKKNKGTVLRKTTELIEKLSDENRELRSLLSRSCEVLQSVYPLINSAVENNAIHLSQEELQNYMELLQALLVKDRSDVLTESPGHGVGELSPSSAASCPPADTPVSMHPPTPSGLSAVPENSAGNAPGSLTGSIPPTSNLSHMPRSASGENHTLILNARSAPSSLSTQYYQQRTAFVKEEDSDMFAHHDLTNVEPAELHTLLAQISSPPSKHEPTDRSFTQGGGDMSQLNCSTSSPSYATIPLGFMEDMDTNDGVATSHMIVNLDGSEGMDM